MTDDGSKVQCHKEQYCIESWNVRSMNQDKLGVVKQEMARVNINILEVSELNWKGTGESNSDDHYIYNCGSFSSHECKYMANFGFVTLGIWF